MVTGLHLPFQSSPLDRISAKRQSVDSAMFPLLSFGEILGAKEKQLQQEQSVSTCSVAAALANLQTLLMAKPSVLEVETTDNAANVDAQTSSQTTSPDSKIQSVNVAGPLDGLLQMRATNVPKPETPVEEIPDNQGIDTVAETVGKLEALPALFNRSGFDAFTTTAASSLERPVVGTKNVDPQANAVISASEIQGLVATVDPQNETEDVTVQPGFQAIINPNTSMQPRPKRSSDVSNFPAKGNNSVDDITEEFTNTPVPTVELSDEVPVDHSSDQSLEDQTKTSISAKQVQKLTSTNTSKTEAVNTSSVQSRPVRNKNEQAEKSINWSGPVVASQNTANTQRFSFQAAANGKTITLPVEQAETTPLQYSLAQSGANQGVPRVASGQFEDLEDIPTSKFTVSDPTFARSSNRQTETEQKIALFATEQPKEYVNRPTFDTSHLTSVQHLGDQSVTAGEAVTRASQREAISSNTLAVETKESMETPVSPLASSFKKTGIETEKVVTQTVAQAKTPTITRVESAKDFRSIQAEAVQHDYAIETNTARPKANNAVETVPFAQFRAEVNQNAETDQAESAIHPQVGDVDRVTVNTSVSHEVEQTVSQAYAQSRIPISTYVQSGTTFIPSPADNVNLAAEKKTVEIKPDGILKPATGLESANPMIGTTGIFQSETPAQPAPRELTSSIADTGMPERSEATTESLTEHVFNESLDLSLENQEATGEQTVMATTVAEVTEQAAKVSIETKSFNSTATDISKEAREVTSQSAIYAEETSNVEEFQGFQSMGDLKTSEETADNREQPEPMNGKVVSPALGPSLREDAIVNKVATPEKPFLSFVAPTASFERATETFVTPPATQSDLLNRDSIESSQGMTADHLVGSEKIMIQARSAEQPVEVVKPVMSTTDHVHSSWTQVFGEAIEELGRQQNQMLSPSQSVPQPNSPSFNARSENDVKRVGTQTTVSSVKGAPSILDQPATEVVTTPLSSEHNETFVAPRTAQPRADANISSVEVSQSTIGFSLSTTDQLTENGDITSNDPEAETAIPVEKIIVSQGKSERNTVQFPAEKVASETETVRVQEDKTTSSTEAKYSPTGINIDGKLDTVVEHSTIQQSKSEKSLLWAADDKPRPQMTTDRNELDFDTQSAEPVVRRSESVYIVQSDADVPSELIVTPEISANNADTSSQILQAVEQTPVPVTKASEIHSVKSPPGTVGTKDIKEPVGVKGLETEISRAVGMPAEKAQGKADVDVVQNNHGQVFVEMDRKLTNGFTSSVSEPGINAHQAPLSSLDDQETPFIQPGASTKARIDGYEKVKPVLSNDEKIAPAKKQPKQNQMPESSAVTTGFMKAGTILEIDGKGPSDQVNAQAAEVVRQLIHQMNLKPKHGLTTMNLQLNPQELGQIDVEMVSTSQGVRVTFFAEQSNTGKLLETQLNQLRESLIDSGVQLLGLNISQHGLSDQKGGFFSQDKNFIPSSQGDIAWIDPNIKETPPIKRSPGQLGEVDYRI